MRSLSRELMIPKCRSVLSHDNMRTFDGTPLRVTDTRTDHPDRAIRFIIRLTSSAGRSTSKWDTTCTLRHTVCLMSDK